MDGEVKDVVGILLDLRHTVGPREVIHKKGQE